MTIEWEFCGDGGVCCVAKMVIVENEECKVFQPYFYWYMNAIQLLGALHGAVFAFKIVSMSAKHAAALRQRILHLTWKTCSCLFVSV